MKFVKLTGYIFASFLAIASLAQPAQAELVGYRLFFQEEGVTLYTGELYIVDSLPSGFYTFDQIKAAGGSLSITLEAATITLDDVLYSSEDGIITDDSGAPIAFAEPLNSSNLGTAFDSPHPAELFIHPAVPNPWVFVRYYADGTMVTGDGIVFAPIRASEPRADAGPDKTSAPVRE